MGIGLSQPVSSKVVHRYGNNLFRVGAATMHGWRETMEDAHSLVLSMPRHPNCGFFGIFDGHSGSLCSRYISQQLPKAIDEVEDLTDTETLRKVVMKTDQDFLDSPEFSNKDDGCAGLFTIAIHDSTTNTYSLINGNVGDSRTVLARKEGDTYKAIACTQDHKPTDEAERRRIESAGGHVQYSRVDGQLALSRAFGDRMLKHPIHAPPEQRKVTSNPDWMVTQVTKDDFLFMACDGIYESNVFTRESVVQWISNQLTKTDDIAAICASVLDECLTRGSRDNMSCIIIQFVNGETYNRQGHEFLPGPWHDEDGDTKFQEAYIKDAQEAGYTLQAALELRKQQLQSSQTTTADPNTT